MNYQYPIARSITRYRGPTREFSLTHRPLARSKGCPRNDSTAGYRRLSWDPRACWEIGVKHGRLRSLVTISPMRELVMDIDTMTTWTQHLTQMNLFQGRHLLPQIFKTSLLNPNLFFVFKKCTIHILVINVFNLRNSVWIIVLIHRGHMRNKQQKQLNCMCLNWN